MSGNSAVIVAIAGHQTPRDAAARTTDDRLLACMGVLNRASAELVSIVGDALADGSWEGEGYTSPEHWLRLKAGISAARARRVVEAARRQADLPTTMGLFEQGQLTLDQVSVVVANVPAAYEASVADMAPFATVDQLRRATKNYAFDPAATDDAALIDAGVPGASPDSPTPDAPTSPPSAPADPEEPASLTMHYTDRGRFHLRYEGPAHEGALIENALRETKDALWRHLNTTDAGTTTTDQAMDAPVANAGAFSAGGAGLELLQTSTAQDSGVSRFAHVAAGIGGGVTMAQAFVELASHSLAQIGSASRRDRYRIYVHLDTDGAWLTGKPRLPRHITDSLTCDGVLQPVWETDGNPVNVGRAQRIVPDRTRRLIDDRDRGCRFPACGSTHGIEAHHIRHWSEGGTTDTNDLVSLCTTHHDAHHRGEFTITGNPELPHATPGALEFHHRGGWPIGYRPPPPRESAHRYRTAIDDVALHATTHGTPVFSPPTGERLNTKWVTFSPRPAASRAVSKSRPVPA